MTNVTAQMSVSLDGYYAGPRSSTDPRDLPAFMEGSEGPGFFRVTRWVIDAMAWRERQGRTRGERGTQFPDIPEAVPPAPAHPPGPRRVRVAAGPPGGP